jgi:glycosyltransferase involved in cell wall biosynthesis
VGIQIGYDAKRFFNNATGLGNYSRTLIHHLDKYHAENQYVLFVHRKFNSKGYTRFKVIEGRGHHALWRSRHIHRDITDSGIRIFHGLSGELPKKPSGNVRFVVTIHDVIFKLYPNWYGGIDRIIYQEKLRHALHAADAVVAISQSTADDLMEYCDLEDTGKLSVIAQSWSPVYNTIDKEQIHVPLLPRDYLLFVGSFYERKNLKNVIWAMSDPKCRDIPLVVVGEGKRRYKQMIRELIDELKLERQVLLMEDVYDELLKQLYLRAHAVIYPSLYEGFGLPVLEAWRCRKPIIISKNSSLQEFGDQSAILLEDPHDLEEMSDAIYRIFHDSSLYNRLIVTIPGSLEPYDPAAIAGKWNDLYQSLT